MIISEFSENSEQNKNEYLQEHKEESSQKQIDKIFEKFFENEKIQTTKLRELLSKNKEKNINDWIN